MRAAVGQADFTDVEQVIRLGEEAESFLGGIDVLVNHAGIAVNRPFEEVMVAQFDTLYNVNIRAMFFLTQPVAKGMAARADGVVINLSSGHAKAIADLDPQAAAADIPARFVGMPADVGELALFLASDKSRYMVGQTLVIDGGQMSIIQHGRFSRTSAVPAWRPVRFRRLTRSLRERRLPRSPVLRCMRGLPRHPSAIE